MKKKLLMKRHGNGNIRCRKIFLIMRLTLFLFFWALVQTIASNGYGQQSRVSMELKNITVNEVLNIIEDQTDYFFLYNNQLIDVNRLVSVQCENEKIENVLDNIFEGTDVKYIIRNRQIILTNQSFKEIEISGKVVDSSGVSLPGVSVAVKGTTTGTVTSIDGFFSLKKVPANAILVFSFVGMERQEVPVDGRSVINVTMSSSLIGVEEVVVTALGISRETKSLGYSVGEVTGENLTKTPQNDVLNALSGKISGVQISSIGGDAGSSSSIIIRGATSLNSNNQPLFIVDGIPVDNSVNIKANDITSVDYGNAISDINPSDIESISILKGPSAAALYGSRAGSGVVLITTKTGSYNKGVGISVNSGIMFDIPYKFLPSQTRFTVGAFGLYGYEAYGEACEFWFGPETNTGIEAPQWAYDGESKPLVAYPDKMKNFLNDYGLTLKNDVSIGGVYDKGTYRISVSNVTNDGVIPHTELDKTIVSLSNTYDVNKALKLSSNINISENSSDNRSASGDNSNANPLYALDYIAPHISLNSLKNYWESGEEGVQQHTITGLDNPYFVANELKNSFKRSRFFGNVKLDWKVSSHISLMARAALDRYTEQRETKVPYSATDFPEGAYSIENLYFNEMNYDFLVTYDKNRKDFSFTLSGGGNYMYQDRSDIYNYAEKLAIAGVYNLSNAVGEVKETNSQSEKLIYSLYGLASLGYKGQVYLDLTARNDWSSTLPENNRSYFYPSASLSVLINEILSFPACVDLFKLRVGVAQVGKDTEPYSIKQSLSIGDDWGDLKRVYESSKLLNANLKPEIATSYEFGTDMAFLKKRLGFNVTYYVSDNKNQILTITDFPSSSGYTSKKINAGLVRSRGWEIGISTTPVSGRDFKWDLNISATRNRTKIVRLTKDLSYITLYSSGGAYARTYVGQNIGDIWSYDYVKVEDKDSPYYGYPLLEKNSYGYYSLQEASEDAMIRIGNFNHDFLIGIQTSFSYKRFRLDASFDWRQGGKFYSATQRYRDNNGRIYKSLSGVPYNDADNLPDEIKANPDKFFGKWVGGMTYDLGGFDYPENAFYNIYSYLGNAYAPGSAAFIPGVYQDSDGNYIEHLGDVNTTSFGLSGLAVGDMWNYANNYIHDASFIKLREIALSYSLPPKLVHSFAMQRFDISVFAQNIMVWMANNINVDPERAFDESSGSFNQGMDKWNIFPMTATVGMKLGLEF